MATTTTRYFVRALYVADAGGEMTKDRALERAKLEMEAFTRALTGAEGEERQQLAFRCGLGGIAYEVRESSGHTHSGRVEVSDYLTGERLQMTTVGLREWRSFHRARAHNSVFFRTLMEHAADHKLAGLVGQEGEQDVEYMDDERGNGDPFVDDASEREALLLAALEAVRTDVMTDPAAFRGASFFRITSQTLRQVQEAVIRCRADGYYSVMDRCIGPDCCGGVCASFDALAAATPEQLLGIIGEGRGVTPSRAEVTDAIAKLKYELGCDPVDYGGVGEAFRVLEESLDAGRKDRELLAGVQRVEMDMREDGERVCWDGVAGTFCFSDGTCHAESIAAMGLDIMRRDP